MTKQIISATIPSVGKYLKTAFSTLLVGIGIVFAIFGVYGLTDVVTATLMNIFGIGLQASVAAAQSFELAGRAAVSIAVIWRLASAITALPAVNWLELRHLFAERGALLALIIASIMTASMQHRFYWWVTKIIDPDGAFQHRTIEAAVNANMVGTLSLLMVFILFYDKGQSIVKPLLVSGVALVIGVVLYWSTISLM